MAHSKDDNPTANRPWFGPIPTGADWNPAHGADPDVIDFHRYAAGEPEHIGLSSVDTLTRQSRLMLSAISPAPRRQSGSAHRTAPGRYAYLRSLSRPLPLRSCASCHRSRTASCRGRSSPSASST